MLSKSEKEKFYTKVIETSGPNELLKSDTQQAFGLWIIEFIPQVTNEIKDISRIGLILKKAYRPAIKILALAQSL